jgi:L-rhamnose mutarotase
MKRLAFKMTLRKGFEEEYQQRHNDIWPELSQLLTASGIHAYSIFLDQETGYLFAFMNVADETMLDALPHQPVMKRWWSYMKDIMECNEDDSPVSVPLKEVFYLP